MGHVGQAEAKIVAALQRGSVTSGETSLEAVQAWRASVIPTPPSAARSDLGRINLLLLGADRREQEDGPPRSDTLVFATLDPEAGSAGLLSIPRDLWVDIPGYGSQRINAAFAFGEAAHPGSGADLARRTVERLLGLEVPYYALVDLDGFRRVVDLFGGVTVDVERPLRDDAFPEGDYGLRRILIQPGLQRLDGETALWYVRSRHADSDFGRQRRQQQILLAAREQFLTPRQLGKLPGLTSLLMRTISTNVGPADALALSRIAASLKRSRITARVIDETMTTPWVTPAEEQVLLPDRRALRGLMAELTAAQTDSA